MPLIITRTEVAESALILPLGDLWPRARRCAASPPWLPTLQNYSLTRADLEKTSHQVASPKRERHFRRGNGGQASPLGRPTAGQWGADQSNGWAIVRTAQGSAPRTP